MKRYLFLLAIFIFFAYYVSKNIAMIEKTFTVSFQSAIGYQVVALAVILVAFLFLGRSLHLVFGLFGKDRNRFETTMLYFQQHAFNTLFPVGGFSIVALYSMDAKRRNEPIASAVGAFIVFTLVSYLALTVYLVFAVIYLSITHELSSLVVVPAMIQISVTLLLLLLLFLSDRRKKLVLVIFTYLNNLLNNVSRFFRKKRARPNRDIGILVEDISVAFCDIRNNPRILVQSVGFALAYHLLNLAAIYILFASMGYSPLYRVIFVGYAVGALLTFISPTPGGVGFAEAGMVATLTSFNVDFYLANTVVVLYRGLSYWLPLLIGFIFLQRAGFLKHKS